MCLALNNDKRLQDVKKPLLLHFHVEKVDEKQMLKGFSLPLSCLAYCNLTLLQLFVYGIQKM